MQFAEMSDMHHKSSVQRHIRFNQRKKVSGIEILDNDILRWIRTISLTHPVQAGLLTVNTATANICTVNKGQLCPVRWRVQRV